MKTRGVIGQRIVAVKQSVKTTRDSGKKENGVIYIELENGVKLYPVTVETDFGDYSHDFTVNKPNRRKR